MKLMTDYSKNQQEWTTATLTEITLLYGGYVAFQVFTLGLSSEELDFNIRRVILIIY